jgi:hypothetical protein
MAEEITQTVETTTETEVSGDEVLSKAYNHPTVKAWRDDALKRKARLRELEAEIEARKKTEAEAEAERMKKNQEFQALYEKERAEREQLAESFKREKINFAVREAAVRLGAIDSTDANFAHLKGVSIGEDGSVTGVDEAIGKILAEKPYLKKADSPPATFGTQPAKGNGSLKWADLLAQPKLMKKIKDENPALFRALKEQGD